MNQIDFARMRGLVPAIVQGIEDGQVLMVGYMNEEALRRTVSEGYVWFYSRSRHRLWKKGETSGHVLTVREICVDCDGDAILLKVTPNGPVCHTGNTCCFFTQLEVGTWK